MTERKMIEEKDVEQALDVLERYWVGKDLTADNSILREKVRDWVKQAIPMNVEGVTMEYNQDIHNIQNRVMARPIRRALNKGA